MDPSPSMGAIQAAPVAFNPSPIPGFDPVALDFGVFQIKWYALAYLAGFVLGWQLAVRLTRLDAGRPNGDDIDEFLVWAILGVILGGRLGYVLFYDLPRYLQEPWEIVRIDKGGMAFHGGLLGMVVAIVGVAAARRISILRLGDVVATVVPIGLFFGRLANFINGELWGRVTTGPLGMVFPAAGPEPRHPSQLYEAALEGVALFLILLGLLLRPAVRDRPGLVTGAFFILYGLFRMFAEGYRQPDPQLGFLALGLTMGQWLCVPMLVVGAGFLAVAWRRGLRPSAPPAETPTAPPPA